MLRVPGLLVALAVVAGVAAICVLASLRYGVAGRRVSAGVVVLCMVALTMPRVGERGPGIESQVIATLREISVAQLQYSTSEWLGRFADTLDALSRYLPEQRIALMPRLSAHYRIDLIAGSRHYAVIAVPIGLSPGPRRAFCVDDTSRVCWSTAATTPELEAGRCPGSWNPIQ